MFVLDPVASFNRCSMFPVLKPEKDSSLVVFGLGAVGLSALLAATARNVPTRIAVRHGGRDAGASPVDG
jgi:Zn-dependent alcohol dehydrogenase